MDISKEDLHSRALLEAEIARLRQAKVPGVSGSLLRLYDFLAAKTLEGHRPNEAEIAIEVFGRSGSFEPGQDAVARVYVHRLRKRLDDFYLRDDSKPVARLSIPRGEYRLVLVSATVADGHAEPKSVRLNAPKLMAGVALAAAVVGLGGGVVLSQWLAPQGPSSSYMTSKVWSDYRASTRPLIVVVGDYYIFGQSDEVGNIARLVREFNVNSREDLYEHMMIGEGILDGAVDLGLDYLPTSISESLVSLAPVVSQRQNRSVITASHFNLRMLHDSDILYVGYLSGLKSLENVVFKGSAFKIGQSYDELVEVESGRRYVSDAARATITQQDSKDYGYFASLTGPTGNRITVVAGTRDAGLAGISEALTDAVVLRQIDVGAKTSAELLLEVKGKNDLGFEYKVVKSSQRASYTALAPQS